MSKTILNDSLNSLLIFRYDYFSNFARSIVYWSRREYPVRSYSFRDHIPTSYFFVTDARVHIT